MMLSPKTSIHPFLSGWLNLPDDHKAAIFTTQKQNDWDTIIQDAKTQGLACLLWRDISRNQDASVPEEARLKLARFARETAAKNMLLANEISQILIRAEKKNIPCVPIRGVALSEELYGSISMRPTGDIDILVKQDQLQGIRESLKENGFDEVEARPGFAVSFDYTLTFFKNHPVQIIAEPRWSIVYPPFVERIDMDTVFSRCVSSKFLGKSCLKLSNEDALLHLCLHLMHHRQSAPLLWDYEIDRFIRTLDINWQSLCQSGCRAGVGVLAHSCLLRVMERFQTPIPEDFLKEIAKPLSDAFERKIVSLLSDSPNVKAPERLVMLFRIQGFRSKLRYVLEFLFPSPEFIRVQYSADSWRKVIFTYIKRIFVFSWKGIEGLFALFKARP